MEFLPPCHPATLPPTLNAHCPTITAGVAGPQQARLTQLNQVSMPHFRRPVWVHLHLMPALPQSLLNGNRNATFQR